MIVTQSNTLYIYSFELNLLPVSEVFFINLSDWCGVCIDVYDDLPQKIVDRIDNIFNDHEKLCENADEI